jgi:hypothetical protein
VIAELVGTDDDLAGRGSGARGTRTPDLSAASRTLSQLSYSPESVFSSKVNAGALAISWRIKPQMQLPLSRSDLNRNQKDLFQLGAVDAYRVDFFG